MHTTVKADVPLWQELELEPDTLAGEDLLSLLVGERVDVRMPGRANVSHRNTAPRFYTALVPLKPWHAPRWRRELMLHDMDERFVVGRQTERLPLGKRVADFPKCGHCFSRFVCESAGAAPGP